MNNKNSHVLGKLVTLSLYAFMIWVAQMAFLPKAIALSPASSSAGSLNVSPTNLAFGNQATGARVGCSNDHPNKQWLSRCHALLYRGHGYSSRRFRAVE